MNFYKRIQQAENYRLKIDFILGPINKRLVELLKQDSAQIFNREGDGWVVLFELDDFPLNAPVGLIDFDALFKMNTEEAIEYLGKYGQ